MKQLVKLTTQLMKFKTTKENPEELKKCINFVSKQLPKNLYVTKGINKGKPYLIAAVRRTKCPKLLFIGHLDVVEAEPEQFNPKIKKDRLYGRGADDMKSGAAIAIQLIKEEKEKDIGLMLTTDEEIGGKAGTAYFSKILKPGLVISLDTSEQKIKIRQKGALFLKIKTKGKEAHGARPWSGDNAIEKLIEIYLQIKKIFPKPNKHKWDLTINLGMIKGGNAYNKVPDQAEMGLDIRYTEKDDINKIIRKIKKIKGVQVEIISNSSTLNINKKNPYIRKLKRIAQRAIGKKIEFGRGEGSTEIKYFTTKGVTAVDFSPYGKGLHGKNEWVSIKSMENVYKILKEFIKTIS